MMEFVGKQFSDGHTAKLAFLRDLLEALWEDVDHPSSRLSPSTADSAGAALKLSILSLSLNNVSFDERILKAK